MDQNEEYLLWVDLEMTGLDHTKDQIIEIAAIVTDRQLNIIEEGPSLGMDEWCQQTHGQSGLTLQVQQSTLSLHQAQEQVLSFAMKYEPRPRKMVMCGNSVHADRLFMIGQMPRLIEHLHYRIIDVSSIKELARSWYPAEYACQPKKGMSHRALDDIKESISELKHYRAHIFR